MEEIQKRAHLVEQDAQVVTSVASEIRVANLGEAAVCRLYLLTRRIIINLHLTSWPADRVVTCH
jgi:hypothetical protein